MTRVDFSDVPAAARLLSVLQRALAEDARPALAGLAGACVLLIGLGAVESVRLRMTLDRASLLEARARENAGAVAILEARAHRVRRLEDELAQALVFRRINVQRAHEIVAIGNALPSGVALVSLRDAGDDWELQGEAERLRDVADALSRLRRLPKLRPSDAIIVSRDERRAGTISFTIGVAGRSPGVAR